MTCLARWADWAEGHWYAIPGRAELGCVGSGFNNWGVQTNQKYTAAMAVLATLGRGAPRVDAQRCLSRALASLRFSLASHVSGDHTCTDGTK